MKISLNLNRSKTNNNVQFEGYKPVKSNTGSREFEFNYVYDEDKKDCYLEIFLLDKDADGNWFVTGKKDPYGNIKPLENTKHEAEVLLEKGKATKINLAKEYGIRPALRLPLQTCSERTKERNSRIQNRPRKYNQ